MAVLSLRPGAVLTAHEAITFCRERIAAYKYPRVVEFRDVLPKNALGKILKDQLVPR
jgi:long-chain acyl-CoA synthetase